MKTHIINYNRLIAVCSILYIAATVTGIILNNSYLMKNLGIGLSPINMLANAIPLMAVLPILMNAAGILKLDERLPFLFFSLILVSFGLIQILSLAFSLGTEISVFYIIQIVAILLQMAAAVVLVLVIIGKCQDGPGVTCAWGTLAITAVLFMTSFSIYDRESILYVSLFPQLASCFCALLYVCMFFRLRGREED